nr:acyl-CoA dehydrogenase family protein [Actinomycetota bacterium]
MSVSDDESEIIALVRQFVDQRVKPQVRSYDESDTYPEPLIEEMKELGFFGLLAPRAHGGIDLSMAAFAQVTEELARGWMSLAGAIGGH